MSLPRAAENTEASPRAKDDSFENVSGATNLLPCVHRWLAAHAPSKTHRGSTVSFLSLPGPPGSQHSCLPGRHFPQTTPQALRSTGGPTSVVGQDFILPIFNRPMRRRLPQRFVAPETFPPGIDSRSWRHSELSRSRGVGTSAGAARKSACATSGAPVSAACTSVGTPARRVKTGMKTALPHGVFEGACTIRIHGDGGGRAVGLSCQQEWRTAGTRPGVPRRDADN